MLVGLFVYINERKLHAFIFCGTSNEDLNSIPVIFYIMMHAHTGMYILKTPSVNRFEDSKCRLTLDLMCDIHHIINCGCRLCVDCVIRGHAYIKSKKCPMWSKFKYNRIKS